jgi:hypothetical protein
VGSLISGLDAERVQAQRMTALGALQVELVALPGLVLKLEAGSSRRGSRGLHPPDRFEGGFWNARESGTVGAVDKYYRSVASGFQYSLPSVMPFVGVIPGFARRDKLAPAFMVHGGARVRAGQSARLEKRISTTLMAKVSTICGSKPGDEQAWGGEYQDGSRDLLENITALMSLGMPEKG